MAARVEDRLQRLEDFEAIRSLKGFYAKCADSKYTDDHRRKPQAEIDAITRRQVDTVFTEDAIWDGGPQFGEIRGRDAIYAHLRSGRWSFSSTIPESAYRAGRRPGPRHLDALAALHLRGG